MSGDSEMFKEPEKMLLATIQKLMVKSAIGGIIKGQSGVIPNTAEAITEAATEVVGAVMLLEKLEKNASKVGGDLKPKTGRREE
jgi:hypothetical protein